MPLNGTIKHGQNLLMVKFHVIHTSQLLKKKENGDGGDKTRGGGRGEETT